MTITSLADRVTLEAVEFPTGSDPKSFIDFSLWGDTLTLGGDAVGNGANLNAYWTSLHTINGSSTLPTAHDETLVLGAAWLACESQAVDTTNALNTGGASTPEEWARKAQAFRVRYERRRNRARGVRSRALTDPGTGAASQQSTDPGP